MQDLLTKGIGHDEFKEVQIGPKTVEIPEGWELVRIEDISKMYAGSTPSRSHDEYYNGEIPWLKSGELNKDFIENTEEEISEEGFKNSSVKWVPKNNVVVAMYGATAGEVGFVKIDCTTNQAILSILPINDSFVPIFLYYLLTKQMKKLVKQRQQGSGQQNLSKTLISDMKLPIPKYEEQKKIGKILLKLDNKINNGEIYKQKLQKLKKGLMQDLLTGKVRVDKNIENA